MTELYSPCIQALTKIATRRVGVRSNDKSFRAFHATKSYSGPSSRAAVLPAFPYENRARRSSSAASQNRLGSSECWRVCQSRQAHILGCVAYIQRGRWRAYIDRDIG